MKIGIIGSGNVGQMLGIAFAHSGHEVMIGTRDAGKLTTWVMNAGKNARVGSTSEAAAFGEMIVFCTKWETAHAAIELAGKENFSGKIVIETTNPLHFTAEGQPPAPSLSFPESAGKKLQSWLPESKVVKCFNIVTAAHMGNGQLSEGKADMFICGNDEKAKAHVKQLVEKWNWNVTDMGDVTQSYLLEGLAMFWIVYGFRNNHWTHAWKLLKK